MYSVVFKPFSILDWKNENNLPVIKFLKLKESLTIERDDYDKIINLLLHVMTPIILERNVSETNITNSSCYKIIELFLKMSTGSKIFQESVALLEKHDTRIYEYEQESINFYGRVYRQYCLGGEIDAVKNVWINLREYYDMDLKKLTTDQIQRFFNNVQILIFCMTPISFVYKMLFTLTYSLVFVDPLSVSFSKLNKTTFDLKDVLDHVTFTGIRHHFLLSNNSVWIQFYREQLTFKKDLTKTGCINKIMHFITQKFSALFVGFTKLSLIATKTSNTNTEQQHTQNFIEKLMSQANLPLRTSINDHFTNILNSNEERNVLIDANFIGIYPHILLLNKNEFSCKVNVAIYSTKYFLFLFNPDKANEKNERIDELSNRIKVKLRELIEFVVDCPLLKDGGKFMIDNFILLFQTIIEITKLRGNHEFDFSNLLNLTMTENNNH